MFWSNLFGWRRRTRKGPKAEPTAQELLRSALAELGVQQKDPIRARSRKKHHTDDYRELVVDGAEKVQFSEALLDLTQESRIHAEAAPDERERMVLPRRPERDASDEATRREAEQAAKDVEQQMGEEWIRVQQHYYTPSERLQTGEVDRTYVIRDDEPEEKRPDRRKRR